MVQFISFFVHRLQLRVPPNNALQPTPLAADAACSGAAELNTLGNLRWEDKMKLNLTLVLVMLMASVLGIGHASMSHPTSSEIDEWTQGCTDKKNTADCWYLGEYERGNGNDAKAMGWYQKRCDIDPYGGCGALAKLELKLGQTDKALELYTRACDYQEPGGRRYDGMKGYDGCVGMSSIAYKKKDYATAAKWAKRACEEKQFIDSCRALKNDPNLSSQIQPSEFPDGMALIALREKNYREGASWLKKACKEKQCQHCCDALKTNPNLIPYAN